MLVQFNFSPPARLWLRSAGPQNDSGPARQRVADAAPSGDARD